MSLFQPFISARPGSQEILITREFDAPRERVFHAYTDPGMLSRWLLPADLGMGIDSHDCRSGGRYRYRMPGPGGAQHAIFGVIHEVAAPERIIQTFEYDGLPDRGLAVLECISFEALSADRTRLAIQRVCGSEAYRDGMVNAGMEPMLLELFRRLDQLLNN